MSGETLIYQAMIAFMVFLKDQIDIVFECFHWGLFYRAGNCASTFDISPPLFMDSKNSGLSQFEPLAILFHRVCFRKCTLLDFKSERAAF